jgi:hypothetical protein
VYVCELRISAIKKTINYTNVSLEQQQQRTLTLDRPGVITWPIARRNHHRVGCRQMGRGLAKNAAMKTSHALGHVVGATLLEATW